MPSLLVARKNFEQIFRGSSKRSKKSDENWRAKRAIEYFDWRNSTDFSGDFRTHRTGLTSRHGRHKHNLIDRLATAYLRSSCLDNFYHSNLTHKFCPSHVKISNPREPKTGFCRDEVRQNEHADIVMKDSGAPTAEGRNPPKMVIKESNPLAAVGAPVSFVSRLQHQGAAIGAALF